MLTLQELQMKLEMLQEQAKQSGNAYAAAGEALKQQLANHNALEGAVMLARQLVEEEKVKDGYMEDKVAEDTDVCVEESVHTE